MLNPTGLLCLYKVSHLHTVAGIPALVVSQRLLTLRLQLFRARAPAGEPDESPVEPSTPLQQRLWPCGDGASCQDSRLCLMWGLCWWTGAGEWRRGDNRLGVGRRRWKGYRKEGGINERCSVEDVAALSVYQTHFLLVSGIVVSEQHQTPDLNGRVGGGGKNNNAEIVWESLRRDLSALTVKKKCPSL